MDEKIAPVQGFSAGIPWSMHLKAYDAYSKRYSPQKALIDLEGRNCRGGFSTGELDMFIPGWREELSEINVLKSRLSALQQSHERLEDVIIKLKTENATMRTALNEILIGFMSSKEMRVMARAAIAEATPQEENNG